MYKDASPVHIMKQLEQSNIYTIMKAQSARAFKDKCILKKRKRQDETKGIVLMLHYILIDSD